MHILKSTITVLFIVGHALSTQAKFQEKEVSVAPEVAGKLVIPDGDQSSKAVLIFHGHNDHMDAVGDLQKQLAHDLAEAGIGSLRINFRGEGVRNNSVITSTLESRKEDAENAYRYLNKQFQSATLGVSGWSRGGSTAIILLGSHPDWFESAVLWSSGGHNLKDGMNQDRDPAYDAMLRKMLSEGKAVYKSWVDITYTRESYISWIGFDAEDYLPNYQGAFLGIRGTADFLPLYEPQWMKILPGKQKAYHILGDADHIFNVLGLEKSQGDTVVGLTVDWFLDTLN